MEFLKGWIANICAALIFITVVELILPDNSIRKYCKFILGLILMVIVMNPLLTFLNQGISLPASIDKYLSYPVEEKDFEGYREKRIEITEKEFERSLENSLNNILIAEFPNTAFKVKVKAVYKEKEGATEIVQINVGYSDSSVEKIEKIKILEENSASVNLDQDYGLKEKEILRILKENIKITQEGLSIYKY